MDSDVHFWQENLKLLSIICVIGYGYILYLAFLKPEKPIDLVALEQDRIKEQKEQEAISIIDSVKGLSPRINNAFKIYDSITIELYIDEMEEASYEPPEDPRM
jgi:hypothetical protein